MFKEIENLSNNAPGRSTVARNKCLFGEIKYSYDTKISKTCYTTTWWRPKVSKNGWNKIILTVIKKMQSLVHHYYNYCHNVLISVTISKSFPEISFCVSLGKSPFGYTLSNTFEMSKSVPQTSRWLSKDLEILWVMDRSWPINKSPGLKSDWLGDIKLFYAKNSYMLLKNNISNIFPAIERKDFGQYFLKFCLPPLSEAEPH